MKEKEQETPSSPRKGFFRWGRSHNSFPLYAVLAFAGFVLFMTFISRDNLIRWIKARSVLREQEQVQRELQTENAAKQAQLDALTANLDSLAAHAREYYQFCEPGEDVYLIEE